MPINTKVLSPIFSFWNSSMVFFHSGHSKKCSKTFLASKTLYQSIKSLFLNQSKDCSDDSYHIFSYSWVPYVCWFLITTPEAAKTLLSLWQLYFLLFCPPKRTEQEKEDRTGESRVVLYGDYRGLHYANEEVLQSHTPSGTGGAHPTEMCRHVCAVRSLQKLLWAKMRDFQDTNTNTRGSFTWWAQTQPATYLLFIFAFIESK